MNISKFEQRALHVLAQGGVVRHERCGRRIVAVDCINRDGFFLDGFCIDTFNRLRRKRLIASRNGAPYRITRKGLKAVRAQLDNR